MSDHKLLPNLRGSLPITTQLLRMGISFFPCGKENGKRPLLREWKPYQERLPTLNEVNSWKREYPNSNLAIVTGKFSGISVIDVDDTAISIDQIQKDFGECNFIVRTPSGGMHLYYKYSPLIKTVTAYKSGIDTRSEGGYVVFAGGVNPKTKKSYEIIKGDLSDLEKLAPIVSNLNVENTLPSCGLISKGHRNNSLFIAVKEYAANCESIEALQVFAERYNKENCQSPLDPNEVLATVKKVWAYKKDNTLFVKGGGRKYVCSESDFLTLSQSPDALTLWLLIASYHHNRKEPFCLDQEKLARRLKWKDRRKVGNAIKKIINLRLLKLVGKKGRANLYQCTKNVH